MKCMTPVGVASVIVSLALPAVVAGQWIDYPRPGIPRTAEGRPDLAAPMPRGADGKPDLSGVWFVDPGGYGLNIAPELKSSEVLPWARALLRERTDNFSRDNPRYRCLPALGYVLSFGFWKIVQSPGTLVVLSEGAYRQILTDGRPLPEDPTPSWVGYSVGHWEGDTFVVKSGGFNDKTWLDFGGHPHTDALRVTERFRRTTFGSMQIEITFEDPGTYTRPWTIAVNAALMPDTELMERACNENEKDFSHFVVTTEDLKRGRHTVPPDVLASYAGAYEVSYLGKQYPYRVEVLEDHLLAYPPAGGVYVLLPVSDTLFDVSGWKIEFFKNGGGEVTNFVVTLAEGSFSVTRKK